jgi:hypothetical protein
MSPGAIECLSAMNVLLKGGSPCKRPLKTATSPKTTDQVIMLLGESSLRGNLTNTCKGIMMDINTALTVINQVKPEEGQAIARFIENYRSKNVVALGKGEAFLIKDKSGREIRCFKTTVTLSADDGDLYQPVFNGPWVYSATGFTKIAKASGITVVFPDTMHMGMDEVPNPFRKENANGSTKSFHCRAVAYGYTGMGMPVTSDRVTSFDIRQYRLMDLLAKAKKFKHIFKVLRTGMDPNDDEMFKTDPQGEFATWAQYPYDESVSVWVNTSHIEGITCLSTILNREKKAEELVQTFAARNAVKSLVGSNAPPKSMLVQGRGGPTYAMEIYCWRPVDGTALRWDGSDYSNLKKISGTRGGIYGDNQVEYRKGTDSVDNDEVEIEDKLDEGEVIDVEHEDVSRTQEPVITASNNVKKQTVNNGGASRTTDSQVSGNTASNTVKKQPHKEIPEEGMKIIRQLDALKYEFPDEYCQACGMFGFPEDQPFTPDQAKEIMKKMSDIIDGGM